MFMTRFIRKLPYINLSISACALSFQTMVLYPWHNDLDKKMNTMIKNIDNVSKSS
jgi:hypothetical protein